MTSPTTSHFSRRLPAATRSPFGQRLRAPMLERRPFRDLPSEDLGWLKDGRHLFSALQDAPSRSGMGDDRVLNAKLKAGETIEYALRELRLAYLVPSSGTVDVNGVRIHARDGAAIKGVDIVAITAIEDADVVMVDVL